MFDKRNGGSYLRSNIGLYLILILGFFFGIYYYLGYGNSQQTNLSDIINLIDSGKVEKVEISNNSIKVKLIDEKKLQAQAKGTKGTKGNTKESQGTKIESAKTQASKNEQLKSTTKPEASLEATKQVETGKIADKKLATTSTTAKESTKETKKIEALKDVLAASLNDKDADKLALNGRVITKKISPYWLDKLLDKLETAKVKYSLTYDYYEPVNYALISSSFMNFLLLIGLGALAWFLIFRQMGDGKSALNFGNNKARRINLEENPVHFEDVAGIEEVKIEIQEIVDFLKEPQKFYRIGAKIPHGVLLVGPPGTGKTLLAKAVATEAGVPFYVISGSDFMEMYVGVGASRVRDMFAEVKKHTPAIIFIDEIDAIGRERGSGLGGSHDEREQTLNQILVEMDGFTPNQGIIVMAATNRPDILDSALTRPGRFDRQITVSPPDILGREEILKVHAKGKPLDPSIDLKEIARITPGFTGADLANLLNEAALLAARKNAKQITYFDIQDAIFKVMIGPEKKS